MLTATVCTQYTLCSGLQGNKWHTGSSGPRNAPHVLPRLLLFVMFWWKFCSALSSSWFRRASEEVNPFQVRYRLTGPTARPQTCGHQQFAKTREHPHGNSRSLPLAKLRREFSRKRIARWVGKARGKVNQLKESGHSRERRSRAHDCNGPKQRAPGEST